MGKEEYNSYEKEISRNKKINAMNRDINNRVYRELSVRVGI